MTRSKLTKGFVAGAAAIATVGGLAALPSAAAAQSYPSYGYGGGYYDPCQRDTTNRATAGGLTGAAIGAAVGSNVAARGVRTEGAVLGGLLGAVVGANIGKSSAACAPGAPQPYGAAAPAMPAGQPYTGAPYNARPYSEGYGYDYGRDYGYNDRRYDDDRYYGGGYYPARSSGGDADGCTLAESPIYLPDGRTQKRFVRVCRDSSGAYQVVD